MNTQTIDMIIRGAFLVLWSIIAVIGAVEAAFLVWAVAIEGEWLCTMIMVVVVLGGLLMFVLVILEMFD